MSSTNSTSKEAWATHAVSGIRGTPKDPATGVPSLDAKWERVRRQIARAFIADPDCAFWQVYLSSNNIYGVTRELATLLDSLALFAEGAVFNSVSPPSVPTLPAHLVGATSQEAIREYRQVLVGRATTAVSSSKVGKRFTERGDEARALYAQELYRFMPAYFDLQVSVSKLADFAPDFEPLRKLAVADVLSTADAAVQKQFDPARPASFAVENAASATALLVANRVPRVSLRTTYQQVFWPETAKYKALGTTITWSSSSPALCYVRAGDLVQWAGGTATVTTVGESFVEVSADVTSASSLRIVPGPYAGLSAFQASCAEFLRRVEVADSDLEQTLLRLSTVTEMRETVTKLATLQAQIFGVSPAMLSVLTRLGISEPTGITPLSTYLKQYSPSLRATTKATTKACLALLEQEGLGLSLTRFLRGDLTFLAETADDQHPASFFQRTLRNAR